MPKLRRQTKKHPKRNLRGSDVPALHHSDCQGRERDLRAMEIKITTWGHKIVEKRQQGSSTSNNTCWWCKPLQDAVQCGHEECVRFLLEHGARVDAEEPWGNPILYHASYRHDNSSTQMNKEIFKILLEAGADVNQVCRTNRMVGPIFMQLAMHGNQFLDVIIDCFEHGANPNDVCHVYFGDNQPYLIPLILFSSLEVFQVFLKYGADPDATEYLKTLRSVDFPPICTTLQHKFLKHAKLLLMYKATLNISGILGQMNDRFEEFSLAQFVLVTKTHTEEILKIFNLLHKFGYNFSCDAQKLPCSHPHHAKAVQHFLNLLKNFCEPLTLKELSRLAIMKCMGTRYATKSNELFLPETLYPFLQFQDVED